MTKTKKLITRISDLFKVKSEALPKTLSGTIRVALEDLEKVEHGARFKVNMGTWFSRYEPGEPCQVCFAGSVMAKTLGCSVRLLGNEDGTGSLALRHFRPTVRRKLNSLNLVREYCIAAAIDGFYGENSRAAKRFFDTNGTRQITEGLSFVDYETNPVQWRDNMSLIANRLEAAGL